MDPLLGGESCGEPDERPMGAVLPQSVRATEGLDVPPSRLGHRDWRRDDGQLGSGPAQSGVWSA